MSEACWLRSLGALAIVLTTSCIVAEPPPYEPPPRTPPLLDLWSAAPPIGETIAVDRATDISPPEDPTFLDFSVPFRSEDRDEPVWYALHIDYMLPTTGQSPKTNRLPPSTFDDTQRVISFQWLVEDVTDGCHQLTLLVAHESSWIIGQDRPNSQTGAGDIAMATWWINVNAPTGERNTLRNCPSRGAEIER